MRKILKAIWDEFIYGGHLAAIGPALIIFTSSKLLKMPLNILMLGLIYFITYFTYLLDRFLDIKKDNLNIRKQSLTKRNRLIPMILILLLLFIFIIIWNKPFEAQALTIILILSGLGYNYAFKAITKKIRGFKNFFVAIFYTITIFMLAFYNGAKVSMGLFSLFLFFAMRIFANTTFYDIKDKRQDSLDGLLTYPNTMNEKDLFNFLTLVNLSSSIPIIYATITRHIPIYSLLILLVVPYSLYYFKLSKTRSEDIQRISYIWADGELVIWPILIILGGLLWT